MSSSSSTGSRRSAAITDREQPEKVAQSRNKGRDVGQRRSVQDLVHPDRFLARRDDAHLLQNNFSAAGGIKFDRQSDELKDDQHDVAIDTQRDQSAHPKEESAEK